MSTTQAELLDSLRDFVLYSELLSLYGGACCQVLDADEPWPTLEDLSALCTQERMDALLAFKQDEECSSLLDDLKADIKAWVCREK